VERVGIIRFRQCTGRQRHQNRHMLRSGGLQNRISSRVLHGRRKHQNQGDAVLGTELAQATERSAAGPPGCEKVCARTKIFSSRNRPL